MIPEVVNQICFKVIGNDLALTLGAAAGQLQLHVMEPMMAECLHESSTLLRNGARTLRERCVDGITANADRCRAMMENSIGIVTALNPVIGYEEATQVAAEALRTGRGVGRQVSIEETHSADGAGGMRRRMPTFRRPGSAPMVSRFAS